MKCPACGNTNAECIIGNYWYCPGTRCTNNTSRASRVETPWVAVVDQWSIKPRAGYSHLVPPNTPSTLYTGSPWQPGQHKVAVGCFIRGAGSVFDYYALFDTWLDALADNPARVRAGAGCADYEVELVADLKVAIRGWTVRLVRELP